MRPDIFLASQKETAHLWFSTKETAHHFMDAILSCNQENYKLHRIFSSFEYVCNTHHICILAGKKSVAFFSSFCYRCCCYSFRFLMKNEIWLVVVGFWKKLCRQNMEMITKHALSEGRNVSKGAFDDPSKWMLWRKKLNGTPPVLGENEIANMSCQYNGYEQKLCNFVKETMRRPSFNITCRFFST